MDKSRETSEKIRPILEAMERSIDSARRKRLHTAHPASPTPTSIPPTRPAAPINEQSSDTEQPYYRQKARPKRPSGVLGRFDDPNYRAQAS